MYRINREERLTPERILKIIKAFQGAELPKIKDAWNYYEGRQRILQKERNGEGKPCNRIVVNYCYNIVQNYLGYLAGIPIQYENDDFETVIDVLNYNDVMNEDSELLRDALVGGRAFEICYIDEEGEKRFRTLSNLECIPVYDDTLNADLLYVIRIYELSSAEETDTGKRFAVEVYGPRTKTVYFSGESFSSLSPYTEEPHFFSQCPITVFSLNKEERPVFAQITSLQDAYNDLLSGEVDDFDAFADAYLVLKGTIADEEELSEMRKKRCLVMDPDASAEYLTKNISDTQITNMLQNVNDQIHKIAASPDFNDDKFMSQSGIAMRYKLVGFENAASAIEANMRKALQRRIELLADVISLSAESSDITWRDVRITFTRNLPQDVNEKVQIVNSLRGLVSDRTLLTLLPFVTNVDEELAALKKQKEEAMSMYDFGGLNDGGEEEENGDRASDR